MRALISLLLIVPLLATAADRTSWDNVTKLVAGQSVEVVRKTGDPVRGALVSTSPDVITLRTKQGEVATQRTEITEIGVKKGGNGKWIGAAIGGTGGLILGLSIGKYLANEVAGEEAKAIAGAAGAAVGGAIGLGIGAGVDSGYKTVYKVR